MYIQHYKANWQSGLKLSTIKPEAWRTIYDQRQSGYARFQKNYDDFHEHQSDLSKSVFIATDKDHHRKRGALKHAFSERALRKQEPLVQSHVDTMIQELKKIADDAPINLVEWFNWTAFDVVADLSFGEPFNCLGSEEYRHWVILLSPKSIIQNQLKNFDIILERVRQRASTARSRPDFITFIVENNRNGMSSTEVVSNASLLVAAGTETIATLLPAVTYLLVTHPSKLTKVVTEIRKTYKNDAAITVTSLKQLEYLPAAINEALRLFPPVPEGLPRVTPDSGEEICGQWIPGGTYVQISPFAANMNPDNFTEPEAFIPERWFSTDRKYAKDRKEVHQPFSSGHRNCIGQNLANAEMRLVIAKLLWHFDLKYVGDKHWMDQPTYMLWEKKPLMMNLSLARDEEESSKNLTRCEGVASAYP
ncbi:hypothetical protein MMC11_002548 [Xylographa trunciseda]|nr:hypothetical protein [Xylographa trunciseda]